MQNNNVQVIIVDDHPLFREGLVQLINSQEGFELTYQVDNGIQLLQQLKTLSATSRFPDLCLLDINMPGLNGYETMKLLNRDFPDLPVMVLSMHGENFSIISMLNLGAKGFLQKNCHKQELIDALKTISNGDYYIPKAVKKLLVADSEAAYPGLTEREIEFLGYCHLDLSYKDIGEKMGVGERTIHGFRDSLFNKLDINTRNGLVAFAFKTGISRGWQEDDF